MKTIGTFVLALVAVVTSAVEKPRLDVYPISADRAVVALINESPAKIEVSVKSEEGRIVYYKQSMQNTADYRKIYDFSALENGLYEISFKVNSTLVKRNIEIVNGSLKVGASELRFDPFFLVDGNMLKVSYLNFDQNNLKLIFMKDRNIVYEAALGKEFSTTKGFDISKLESGSYDVILADGSNDYRFTLEK